MRILKVSQKKFTADGSVSEGMFLIFSFERIVS